MSIDVEYAIKKDIRNNPVVREIDTEQKREFLRSLVLGTLVVGALLFSAWQHQRMLENTREIEQLQGERAAEEELSRKLLLTREVQRAPQELDARARRELHMVAPTAADTLVIERAPVPAKAGAVIAAAR